MLKVNISRTSLAQGYSNFSTRAPQRHGSCKSKGKANSKGKGKASTPTTVATLAPIDSLDVTDVVTLFDDETATPTPPFSGMLQFRGNADDENDILNMLWFIIIICVIRSLVFLRGVIYNHTSMLHLRHDISTFPTLVQYNHDFYYLKEARKRNCRCSLMCIEKCILKGTVRHQ